MDEYSQNFPLDYTDQHCNRIYIHRDQTHIIKQTIKDDEQKFLKEFKQRYNHFPTHIYISRCHLIDIESTEVIRMPYHHKDLFEMLMDGKKFTEREVIKLAYQLAQAIIYWHTHDILYGDLKLENICLNDGHVQLIDFDRCKFLQTNEELTVYSSTTASMPPEIIFNLLNRNRPDKHIGFGKEVDWWSYGVVIYELAYGIHPFQVGNKSPNQVAQNILYRAPERMPKVIDPLLKNFLESLLTKVRTNRLKQDADVLIQPVFYSFHNEKLI